MNFNKTVLSTALATSLALLNGNALAANFSTSTSAANGTSLFLSIWDKSTNWSYQTSLFNPAVSDQTFLNNQTVAADTNFTISSVNFSAFLGKVAANDNVVFTVVAADKNSADNPNALFTQTPGSVDLNGLYQNQFGSTAAIQAFGGVLDTWFSVNANNGVKFTTSNTGHESVVSATGTLVVNQATGVANATLNTSTAGYAGTPGVPNQPFGSYMGGTLGNASLGFSDAVAVNTSTTNYTSTAEFVKALSTVDGVTVSDIGSWALSINPTTKAASLIFTPAANVVTVPAPVAAPIPGAIWFMLTGLIGFFGFNKRIARK